MSAADVCPLPANRGLTWPRKASNTTLVGTLLATDPDAGNTYTYSLTNNAGGRFAIDTITGQITVANGSLLDFETATSHTITARVTDQNNLTYDEVVTINLSNTNDAPVLDNSGTMTLTSITEDQTRTAGKPLLPSLHPPAAIALRMQTVVLSRALRLRRQPMAMDRGNTRPTAVRLGMPSVRFQGLLRYSCARRTWCVSYPTDRMQPAGTLPSELGSIWSNPRPARDESRYLDQRRNDRFQLRYRGCVDCGFRGCRCCHQLGSRFSKHGERTPTWSSPLQTVT